MQDTRYLQLLKPIPLLYDFALISLSYSPFPLSSSFIPLSTVPSLERTTWNADPAYPTYPGVRGLDTTLSLVYSKYTSWELWQRRLMVRNPDTSHSAYFFRIDY